MPPRVRSGLKQAYKLLYRSNLNLSQAIEAIEADVESSEERDYLLAFLSNIRRGYSGRLQTKVSSVEAKLGRNLKKAD